jgi:RNA polymerase sigma-70 factor (ECF subfamily)
MGDEEQRLVAAAKSGDVEAFNQIVQLYETRVYNLCYRMLGDADSAADAAQDTFITTFRKLRTYRGGSFRSWILRIATNTCYDILRARKRRPAVSLDAAFNTPDTEPAYDPPDQGESPDEFVLRRELGEAIQQSLAMLPEDQRLVIILCDIQGMAYNEIVEITGANMGTIKSRLSRGRARLRDILKARELLPGRYRHGDE